MYHILSQHRQMPNHRLKIRLTVRWWVTTSFWYFNHDGFQYCSITVKMVINVVTLSKDKKHCDPIFSNQSRVLPDLFEIFLDHMPSCHLLYIRLLSPFSMFKIIIENWVTNNLSQIVPDNIFWFWSPGKSEHERGRAKIWVRSKPDPHLNQMFLLRPPKTSQSMTVWLNGEIMSHVTCNMLHIIIYANAVYSGPYRAQLKKNLNWSNVSVIYSWLLMTRRALVPYE